VAAWAGSGDRGVRPAGVRDDARGDSPGWPRGSGSGIGLLPGIRESPDCRVSRNHGKVCELLIGEATVAVR